MLELSFFTENSRNFVAVGLNFAHPTSKRLKRRSAADVENDHDAIRAFVETKTSFINDFSG